LVFACIQLPDICGAFSIRGKRDGLQKLSKSDSGCLINFSSPPPKGKPQKKWWEKGARPFLLFSAKGAFPEEKNYLIYTRELYPMSGAFPRNFLIVLHSCFCMRTC
jgi:hypothetical protein